MRDRVLVGYEISERKLEFLKTKLQALTAIASTSNEKLAKEISSVLDEYNHVLYSQDFKDETVEDSTMKSYEEIMDMKLSIVRTQKGLELQKG